MNVTDLSTVQSRIVGLLLANRTSPFSATVGTGSSANSRYTSNEEIKTAAIEADALVVMARISNPGDPYMPQFLTWANGLADGDYLPGFVGAVGHMDVDVGAGYGRARIFKSADEAIEVKAHPALYPDVDRWGFIEAGRVFHNGTLARVRYPAFTKTPSACQSPETDQTAVVFGAIHLLRKDGSVTPELYDKCEAFFTAYLAMLKGENTIVPDITTVERQLAA